MSPVLGVLRLLYICKDLVNEALTFIPLMARSQASLAADKVIGNHGSQVAALEPVRDPLDNRNQCP